MVGDVGECAVGDHDVARAFGEDLIATAELSKSRERYAATLALAPEAAASLSGWCQLSPAGNVPRGKAIPADWVLHKVDFESLSQAQFVALGFGPRVRVLAPDELRERVRVDIAAAAAVRTERKRPI